MKISRRWFAVLGMAFIAAPRSVLASNGGSLLRPPGSAGEDDFMARCNRCQRCVQVCPTRVVLPSSFAHGIIRANTPEVTFSRGYCNSCLKCASVCPTGALKPVTKNTLDIGLGVIVESNCVAWDWEGCTVCVDKCPLKAIYLDAYKRPAVFPERCNGCGVCQFVCPSTSLRVSIKGKGIVVMPRPDNAPRKDPEVAPEDSIVYPDLKRGGR